MYRKLYHLGGLFFPLIIFIFSKKTAIYTCALVFAIVLSFDLFRLNWRQFNLWILKNIRFVFKKQEVRHFSGSPFFLGGVLLTLLLFKVEYAIGGIIFLSIGDSSAAIIGKNFGRHQLFGKTIEGTIGFLVVSVAFIYALMHLGIVTLPFYAVLAAGTASALVELIPVNIDDNLTIPLVGALVLKLFS